MEQPPFASENREKYSNSAVFEINKNFIVGIQFLASTLARKNLATLQVPRNIHDFLEPENRKIIVVQKGMVEVVSRYLQCWQIFF